VIEAQGISKEFNGEYAVQDLTFYVPRGAIFGFIGPSGSGKTTTVRMLTGYYAPSSGEVLVYGKQPSRFSQEMRERIGYMPQLFVLYPQLSVWENLNFAASIYGMSYFRGKRLKEMLEFVELNEHRNKLAQNISGGMQRRLSLAATLVHNPDLIFLDEPTAGIDPVLRSKFWEHFRSLRDQGRSLFVTTQYVGEAAYCDLVAVMKEGRLLMVNTPANLRVRAFGGDVVDLRLSQPQDYRFEYPLRELPFVKRRIQRTGDRSYRLIVQEASTAVPEILEFCQAHNVDVESIEEFSPPFDDVFVQLVKDDDENAS